MSQSIYSYRQKRNTKKRYLFFIGIILASALGYYQLTKTDELPNKSLSVTVSDDIQVPTKNYDLSSVTFPTEGYSAIGTLEGGPSHASHNDEVSVPMASITKVVTALAILKKAPIPEGGQGDTITLNQQDEQYYHDYVSVLGTVSPVTAGLEMTQYEAIQAMLLPSANNMADTLVDRYFESREEFIDYANNMLENYGLTKTKIADASGFNPGSVSTPSELIVVGQKALRSRVIAEIVKQPEATITVAGVIPNYNNLILEPGVTGIKPGHTDEAGLCLLFSAEVKNAEGDIVTVIGATLGIQDRSVYRLGTLAMLNEARTSIKLQ
jgi:serine-type D-Ala-D-Ala carboxypeptidase (penicillin-binding protein 5/6)